MALGPAQLADAIVRYLDDNAKRFERFLLNEFKVHVLVDFNVEDEDKQRRVIAITT